MKDAYKGYDVELEKRTGKFIVSLNGDELVRRDSWEACVTYIEGQLNPPKGKKKFVPFEAALVDWNSEITMGRVTSNVDNGGRRCHESEVWFVNNKGRRSKESASRIAPLTDEVMSKIKEIEDLKAVVKSTNQRIAGIEKSLPRYKPVPEAAE